MTGVSSNRTSVVIADPDSTGAAPTLNPTLVAGSDAGGLKRTFATDTYGNQIIVQRPDTAYYGTISALYVNDSTVGGSLKVAVPAGARSASVSIRAGGTLSGSVQVRYVNSTGDQSQNIFGYALATTTATTLFSPSGATSYAPLKFIIPPGASYLIAVCTAYSSGSAIVDIVFSDDPCNNLISGSVTLNAATARIGSLQRVTTWTRESTTPVNANQSITGANKTTFNTSSGTALNTATSYGDRFCAYGGSDVAGTLIIEASPDTGTTWYPVTSVALAQVGASGNFGAYLDAPIVEATMRGRLLNGATNQARAVLLTKMIG